MDERCDQIIHCNDKSDEKNCQLVVFEESYNKKIPPFTTDKTEIVPVRVNVSIFLKNVLKIEESLHTIDMKVGISLGWKETTRVQYHNLKQEEALNILDNDEVNFFPLPIFPYSMYFRLTNYGSHTLSLRTQMTMKQSSSGP